MAQQAGTAGEKHAPTCRGAESWLWWCGGAAANYSHWRCCCCHCCWRHGPHRRLAASKACSTRAIKIVIIIKRARTSLLIIRLYLYRATDPGGNVTSLIRPPPPPVEDEVWMIAAQSCDNGGHPHQCLVAGGNLQQRCDEMWRCCRPQSQTKQAPGTRADKIRRDVRSTRKHNGGL